jgi:hypothetical protein
MPNSDLQELLGLLRMREAPANQEAVMQTRVDPDSVTSETASAAIVPTSRQLADEMGGLAAQMEQLRQLASTKVDSLHASTNAAIRSATTASSTGGGISDVFGKIFSSTIESGFGLAPMISGLFHLFGGGVPTPPPPLQYFALPSSVNMDGGITPGRQFAEAGYSQDGLPRAVPNPGPQQVQVTVHAMDSRSFLDHSDDIAKAVKEAMLNSHSLNDVVADL